MARVLKVEIILTDQLLKEVSEVSCCSSVEEAEEGLVKLAEELNDPKQLVLIMDNLDYFNY